MSIHDMVPTIVIAGKAVTNVSALETELTNYSAPITRLTTEPTEISFSGGLIALDAVSRENPLFTKTQIAIWLSAEDNRFRGISVPQLIRALGLNPADFLSIESPYSPYVPHAPPAGEENKNPTV